MPKQLLRRRSPLPRPSTCRLLETLESRVLLNGLTIITHGYMPFDNSAPAWVAAMGSAIAARDGTGTSTYKLVIAPLDANTVQVTSFTLVSGPGQSAGSNGEAILLLDWAAASGIVTQHYSTSYIASIVAPYLEQPDPAIGINAPLAEGSIQLIGHSRGASMMAQLANDFGQVGIWVDQLTTLDPVPGPYDPLVTTIPSNVVFADNYYQNSGDGVLTPNGTPLPGALNIGPLSLGGAYGIVDGTTHSDVHLFYYGTINTANNANDGQATVVPSWYTNNGLPRTSVGFVYTRIAGGARPAAGLSAPFGGSGTRTAVTPTGAQWPNIGYLSMSAATIQSGQPFSVSYRYQDSTTPTTIQWFLDTDQNPYNGNSIPISDTTSFAATGSTIAAGSKIFSYLGAAGTYYVEAKITDGTYTRYAYTHNALAITQPVKRLVFTTQPVTTAAGTTFATMVEIRDSFGHTLADNSTITLSLATSAGATLNGATSVQAINGVATFSGLSLTKSGTYNLVASDGSILAARSSAFTITPDFSTEHLVLLQQPTTTIVGKPLFPALVLNVVDQYNNLVITEKSSATITIESGPPSATLSGTTTIAFRNGAASFSTLKLNQAGAYTLTATDMSLAINNPVSFNLTVSPATTKVATPRSATYSFGQTITLSPVFTSNAPATIPFTGSATLMNASTQLPIGTATLTAAGAARFSFAGLLPGSYPVDLVYPGDNNHTAVTTPNFTLKIVPAASTTKLTVSSRTAFFGEPFTLTATVSSTYANSTDHTGTITFKDGTLAMATITLSGSTATYQPPMPTPGTHVYTATYSGDSNFNGARPASAVVTIKKDPTVATLSTTASGALHAGDPFTLTATVSSQVVGSAAPTGQVIFKDGAKVLATVTLNSSGAASWVGSLAAAGTHVLTVYYKGDALNNVSTSQPLLQVVLKPTV
jgi:hypothetical protein